MTQKNCKQKKEKIKIGSFICPYGAENNSPVGIVIYDHSIHGKETKDLFSIKWMNDGGISLKDGMHIKLLSSLDFCKVWCDKQISYAEV